MNRMVSQVSTSVENTADSASAPSHAGSAVIRNAGSTSFGLLTPGTTLRAAMPKMTGTNANSIRTSALRPMPSFRADSDRAL